ncbi:hypothetical protein ACFW53_20655 [Nocardiopsis dassonvillei]|uniref:hypothetical protein n=1 Tax=Nocardiopsis dassonvillei TaxID=2014 RepID=UPI00366B70CD
MSIIAEVTKQLGVNREAVLRVAREGGSGTRDWEIAVAIEKAGGRKAADLMSQPDAAWRAEHTRLQDALWEETKPEDVEFLREHAAQAGITDMELLIPGVVETREGLTRPTNPHAIHDPQVRVYDEPTAPDAPPTVLPDHPHEDTPSEDEVQAHTEGTVAWRELTIWPGIARITGSRERTDRLMARWATTRAIHRGVRNLLRATRRPRLRALVASYTLTA